VGNSHQWTNQKEITQAATQKNEHENKNETDARVQFKARMIRDWLRRG
jgi:hypothetical protein